MNLFQCACIFFFREEYISSILERAVTVFTRNDTTALLISQLWRELGDNSSYAGSEAREVFINSSSDNGGVNK